MRLHYEWYAELQATIGDLRQQVTARDQKIADLGAPSLSCAPLLHSLSIEQALLEKK